MLNYWIFSVEILLASFANLLLKKGSSMLANALIWPKDLKAVLELLLMVFKNVYILAGLVSFAVAFVLWVWLLSKIQLNIFYPIALSTQIILIAVASHFLFKESLSSIHVLGISIIILGVFLLSKSS